MTPRYWIVVFRFVPLFISYLSVHDVHLLTHSSLYKFYLLAKVWNCISELQCFKMSVPIWFFLERNKSTLLLEIYAEYFADRNGNHCSFQSYTLTSCSEKKYDCETVEMRISVRSVADFLSFFLSAWNTTERHFLKMSSDFSHIEYSMKTSMLVRSPLKK